jgi:hypothetical protein
MEDAMDRTRTFLAALLGSIALFGCGGSGSYSAADIKDQTPQGTINGKTWSLVKAEAKLSSFETTKLDLSLYGEDAKPCGIGFSPTKEFVIFSVKNAVGEYPLKLELSADAQTVTFVTPPASNTIAASGVLKVESTAADKVTIGVVADAGSGGQINGKFTADICPK